ncbi:hypothetical protein [Phenylobacterium sp.]|uniref:hypothetical protein n=1 Tax=Phenylobacterium sp. TaxID=1871053 RepID=UPI0035AEDDB9
MTVASAAAVADIGLKGKLRDLLKLLADDGRGPFERWADRQGGESPAVPDLSDRYLRHKLQTVYGGAEMIDLLTGAGLTPLLMRDLSRVLGSERAAQVLAAPPAEGRPPRAPADEGATLSWPMIVGVGLAIAASAALVVIFAGFLLRVLAALITFASIGALYRGGGWRILAFVGFFTFVALNSVADRLEGRATPGETPEAAASPSDAAISLCREAAGSGPGVHIGDSEAEPRDGGYLVSIDELVRMDSSKCGPMRFTARCMVRDGKATVVQDWADNGYDCY